MEAVNSLEKDPYIKAGTAPFMVGTYTAGFLQNLRSEMDENDGFNMRSFAEATVKTFVPLYLARLIGGAILTTTAPWFAVLGTGIAVGMLTDNLVNQNFFDDGTSSAADKLFEWGDKLSLGLGDLYDNTITGLFEFADDGLNEIADLTDTGFDWLEKYLEEQFQISLPVYSAAQDMLELLGGVIGTNPTRRVDPLTFDLDGDGIELINLEDSSAFFDIDGDGLQENVGWINSDDGILVYDKNNNGSIDNINELFGDASQLGTVELATYDSNGDGIIDRNDEIFSKLQLWQDYNQNGTSEAGELKYLSDYNIVSIDVNPDNLIEENRIEEGNLIISSSSYNYETQEEVANITIDENGNETTTITIENVIKTSILSNLDLAVNQTNSRYYSYHDNDGTLVDYDLNIEILPLPLSRGYGNLLPWHIAMSIDETLLNKMQEITSLDPTQFYDSANNDVLNGKIEEFLYIWAEKTDVTGNRGSFSAQKLETIEAFTGFGFVDNWGNTDIAQSQLSGITNVWKKLVDIVKERILIQNLFSKEFSNSYYDKSSDNINYTNEDLSNVLSEIANIYNSIESNVDSFSYLRQVTSFMKDFTIGKISSLDSEEILMTEFLNIVGVYVDDSSASIYYQNINEGTYFTPGYYHNATANDDYIILNSEANILNSGLGNDVIYAGAGNDEIYADAGNDEIYAGDGSDILVAGSGDNILEGGLGNDQFYGQANGNDTYIFNLGDGHDYIDEDSSGGIDKIKFGNEITVSNIILTKIENNLIIKFKDTDGNISTNDSITIHQQFSSNSDYRIEYIEFVDENNDVIVADTMNISNPESMPMPLLYAGTANNDSIKGSNVADTIKGDAGNDYLYGFKGNDIIYGGIGDDKIYSSEGNDELHGNLGNDILVGYSGDDSYFYNLGDGFDVIKEYEGIIDDNDIGYGADTIIFGSNISSDSISFIKQANNLVVNFIEDNGATSIIDKLTIENQFSGNSIYIIETIEFDDGTTINIADLTNLTYEDIGIGATQEDDSITLNTLFTDKIETFAGDDYINASYDSQYKIDSGDGNDRVYTAAGADQISSGQGDDYISAGEGNNIIDAGSGNDIINSNAGNDVIYAGEGDDYVNGGAGADQIDGGAGADRLYAGDGDDIVTGGADNDEIDVGDGNNYADGGAGDDVIYYGYGDNIIKGGDGNDYIYNYSYYNAGNDTIEAGVGDDYIDGGYGDDTYIFNLGDGADEISDQGGSDTIKFTSTISHQDILFETIGSNLIIRVSDYGDQITITNFLASESNRINYLEFSDGSIFDITNGITILGSDQNDNIIGTPFSDDLSGSAGDDYIYGGLDSDLISGGQGADYLCAGAGSDIYKFSAFDGNDRIFEEGGIADLIYFDDTIIAEDLALQANGNDLEIFNKINDDVITIKEFFSHDNRRIEYAEFADGDKFNFSNIVTADLGNLNYETTYSINGYALLNEEKLTKIKLLNYGDGNSDYSNITSYTAASNGTVSMDENGELYYISNNNYFGDDLFTISYQDSDGNSLTKNINIKVQNINDSPVASALNLNSYEDNYIEITPLDSATDIDGDDLSIFSVGSATYGVVDIIDNKIIYTPNHNFYGTDSFTYTIADGNGETDTATITINVEAVNDAPIANADNFVISEDVPTQLNILDNDSDVDNILFMSNIIEITDPINGSITINSLDGSLLYTPHLNYYGLDSFSYVIQDSLGATSTANVNINIEAVNDLPTASVISAEVNVGEILYIDVLAAASDVDGDVLNIIAVGQAMNGSAELIDNKIRYIPNTGYYGSDIFTYTISDSNGGEITTELVINVIGQDIIREDLAQEESFFITEKIDIDLSNINSEYAEIISLSATLSDGSDLPDWLVFDSESLNFSGRVPIDYNGQIEIYIQIESLGGHVEYIPYILNARGTHLRGVTTKGDDYIQGTSGSDYIRGSYGSDQIYGGLDDDFIKGGAGDDELYGGSGYDLIRGGDGDDFIRGGNGDDRIYGNDGNDALVGNRGNDFIVGGAGQDKLYGGIGSDIFDFNYLNESTNSNLDFIGDFEIGTDMIDLSDIEEIAGIHDLLIAYIGNNTFIKDLNSDFTIELANQLHLKEDNFIFA